MNRKISLGAAAALIIIAIALTISVTMIVSMRHFDYTIKRVSQRQAMFDYITNVDKEVRQNYYGEINEGALRDALAKGYIQGLGDDYAAYLTASEYSAETERLSGKMTGLGIRLVNKTDGTIVISYVHKNSAANKAGIQKGDVLVIFNGTPVEEISFSRIQTTLNTAEKAKLTIVRGSDSIAYEISSSTYTLNSVSSRIINDTGYIRISDFFSNTPSQFKNAYESLENQGVDNYIFDLRFNTGGNIAAANEIIGFLLPRGTYARKVNDSTTVDLTSSGTLELIKPSVTLINANTAGEAELFAGALREFGKTTLIGTKSTGRGMIQQFYPLRADGAALKISVASLNLVGLESWEGIGLTPDIDVKLTVEQYTYFDFLTEQDDPQLAAALTNLRGGSSSQTTTEQQQDTTQQSETGTTTTTTTEN